MSDSKNDVAWRKLFDKYCIVSKVQEQGTYEITAEEIREFREARLMTKFDFKDQLPEIFSINGLQILPITRGRYIIGKFENYKKIKEPKHLKTIGVDRPHHIETIDIENITSETTALLCANICGILKDFFDEDKIYHTIGGRMSSGSFEFSVLNIPIEVSKAQIEIDGGFESDEHVYLIEVKNLIHDDFLIRQIYYPYRAWVNKLYDNNVVKSVRNIFLTYSDGIFYLREYDFVNDEDPSSIKLVKQARYSIVKNSLSIPVLEDIINNEQVIKEPSIPFPQSNDINKTINLCELLYYTNDSMSKDDIAYEFGFVLRQSDYYGNSARYLGLVDYFDDEKKYVLNETGRKIFDKPLQQRQYEIAKLILLHEPFRIVMKFYLKHGENPTTEVVMELLRDCNLYNVSKDKSTYKRRCSTIISWINWILDRVEV